MAAMQEEAEAAVEEYSMFRQASAAMRERALAALPQPAERVQPTAAATWRMIASFGATLPPTAESQEMLEDITELLIPNRCAVTTRETLGTRAVMRRSSCAL
jgi:hypothetical protein